MKIIIPGLRNRTTKLLLEQAQVVSSAASPAYICNFAPETNGGFLRDVDGLFKGTVVAIDLLQSPTLTRRAVG